MYIAVCEDEQIYIEGMQHAIENWQRARGYSDVHTRVYLSADDLLDEWESGHVFDVLFLDIGFKYLSGFDLAKRIRESDPNVPIVFVTNNEGYLQKGYEVSAYRYLIKPIREQEVHECLDHCYRYSKTMDAESFIVSKQGYALRMPYRDVLYIVSGIHTVRIFTRFGKDYQIPIKCNLDTYIQQFPQAYFLRCHRGYIVNIMHACKYTRQIITLIDGTEIPIGKFYSKPTLARLHEFFYKEVQA